MDTRVPPLRVIVADELGQLKAAQAPDAAHLDSLAVVSRWGDPTRGQSIECMAVGSAGGLGDTASAALAVGRVDGGIEVRNPFNGVVQWKVPGDPQGGKAAAIRGLHLIYSGPAAGSGAGGGAAAPLALSCTQGGVSRVHAAGEEGGAAVVASWAAPADVFCTAFDPGSGLLAVGAQGTELRLYDAAAGGQPAFVAKGGRPNAVGLPDRPWNSAAAFLPGGGGSKVVVGTGYRKLRLYDSKAGKRPQLDVAFGEARVTALAPQADGLRCWVANGLGQVEAFDFRAGRFCGAVKGIAGSVRTLALHPDRPVLLSAGLDRFLRLHDTATRRPLGKVYLKSQLTGAQFCPTDASMAAPPPEEEEGAAARGEGRREAAGKRKEERGGGGGGKRRPKERR